MARIKLPRALSRRCAVVLLAVLLFVCANYVLFARASAPWAPSSPPPSGERQAGSPPPAQGLVDSPPPPPRHSHPPEGASRPPLDLDYAEEGPHPIPAIIADARRRHQAGLLGRSHTVEEAAAAYRERRGRHPPPGFDQWARHALQNDTIVVEQFWDRIYHDLAPFWGLEAATIARRGRRWEHVIEVRAGRATFRGDVEGRVPWMQLWTGLVGQVAEFLPDLDVPINMMDEPRLLVPWETIAEYVHKERGRRRIVAAADVTAAYTPLADDENRPAGDSDEFRPRWFGRQTSYWELARLACPPGSAGRDVAAVRDDDHDPPALPADFDPAYAFGGYVVNFTAASDPCEQPHLAGMHGSLVSPLSVNTSEDLLPLFGGSKLRLNNEILLPGAMYLTQDAFYSGGDWHGPGWDLKTDGLVWRGDATGGLSTADNWARFQRHRLVQMLNGTTVAQMEVTGSRAPTFALPPERLYPSRRRAGRALGRWLSGFADAGFVHRLCEGEAGERKDGRRWWCGALDPWLGAVEGIDMAAQYRYKFLVDADGNSFSARFRGFLLSTSVPIKATAYAEWHEDRLAPWVHFIPLDNSFRDLYGVLEYFGDSAGGDGDRLAGRIAEEGKRWAEQVLRRDDMALYVWRLLLEWARVCDVNRDTLGYVADLG